MKNVEVKQQTINKTLKKGNRKYYGRKTMSHNKEIANRLGWSGLD